MLKIVADYVSCEKAGLLLLNALPNTSSVRTCAPSVTLEWRRRPFMSPWNALPLLAETSAEERASWPSCFWNAGIAPFDQGIADATVILEGFDYVDPAPPLPDANLGCEWFRDGWLVVAGDGACSDQGTLLARAGCGAYFGEQRPCTSLSNLRGPCRTLTALSCARCFELQSGLGDLQSTSH